MKYTDEQIAKEVESYRESMMIRLEIEFKKIPGEDDEKFKKRIAMAVDSLCEKYEENLRRGI